MRVLVINYCGKVGKTIVAAHMLKPRMNGATIYAVETINEAADGFGLDVEKIKGGQFGKLFRQLMTADCAIIDVGASNSEIFVSLIADYEGSSEEFDAVVVPVTSESRVQKETIKTVNALELAGFTPEKIRILFNRVDDNVQEEFAPIIGFAKSLKKCIANPAAAIHETELFDLLTTHGIAIDAVLEDQTDYKAMLRALDKQTERRKISQCTDMLAMKALAKGVTRQLDAAYSALLS